MTSENFRVQAALLYDTKPQVDFQQFMMWFAEMAQSHGLPGPYMLLPGAGGLDCLCFAGDGLNVEISIQGQPLDKAAFALALRAPILRQKNFDFGAVVETHQAAIVITVSDGELPMSPEAQEMLTEGGAIDGVDPLAKLKVLHLALQGINTMTRAKMIDFCPSQMLLTVPELVAVSHMGLPVPLLYHPFPVRNTPAEDGTTREGMAAIHAPRLIGTEIELEAIPTGMPLQTRLDLLSALIARKLDGTVLLKHGESVELTPLPKPWGGEGHNNTYRVWLRHEEGSEENGPVRVIASFDTRAPLPKTSVPTGGHQAFQDRIARLKSPETPKTNDFDEVEAPPSLYSETEEELRERVQDAIGIGGGGVSTETRRGFGPSKLLLIGGAVGVYFLVMFASEGPSKFFGSGSDAQGLMSLLLGGSSPLEAEEVSSGEITSNLRTFTHQAFGVRN